MAAQPELGLWSEQWRGAGANHRCRSYAPRPRVSHESRRQMRFRNISFGQGAHAEERGPFMSAVPEAGRQAKVAEAKEDSQQRTIAGPVWNLYFCRSQTLAPGTPNDPRRNGRKREG